MIAIFENNIYKSKWDKKLNKYRLVSFVPVYNFDKGKTLDGDAVWRKFVDKEELDELYDIDFFAVWKGHSFNCGCYVDDDIVVLRTRTQLEFAETHGFEEIDRNYFIKKVPINECSSLGFVKTDYLNNSERERKTVTIDEFKILYQKNIVDLR